MNRIDILNEAARLTGGDRDKTYGNPVANYTHTAGLITAYFKDKIVYQFTAEDAAMIMALVKMSRIAGGVFKPDNFIDGAAYIAIAGECRQAMEKTVCGGGNFGTPTRIMTSGFSGKMG